MTRRPHITPVILCGGAGKRLWPLSRQGRPKQFLALDGTRTLLQQTSLRVSDVGTFAPPMIATSDSCASLVEAQLREVGVKPSLILLEPKARDTAPAIALAALNANDGDLLLVMPSDHVVTDEVAFLAAVETGRATANEGWLVTFGVRPTRAETGYGYVHQGEQLAPGCHAAAGFVEKPDREGAERLVAHGSWLWNAGIFLFRADAYLGALDAHAPEIAAAARHAVAKQVTNGLCVRPHAAAFAATPALPVDRAVLERSDRVAVVPVEMGWSDIGNWESLYALAPHDDHANSVAGDVFSSESSGCLIRSEGPTIVALGVSDLVIVATKEAVLVVPRGESHRIANYLRHGAAPGVRECDTSPR